MPIRAPCHYARHYARASVSPCEAKGDFHSLGVGWHEVRKFVHSPRLIVKPTMRIAGGEVRLRVSGQLELVIPLHLTDERRALFLAGLVATAPRTKTTAMEAYLRACIRRTFTLSGTQQKLENPTPSKKGG